MKKKRQRLPNSLAEVPHDSLPTGVSMEVHRLPCRAETDKDAVAYL
jgi:hypothetical protein